MKIKLKSIILLLAFIGILCGNSMSRAAAPCQGECTPTCNSTINTDNPHPPEEPTISFPGCTASFRNINLTTDGTQGSDVLNLSGTVIGQEYPTNALNAQCAPYQNPGSSGTGGEYEEVAQMNTASGLFYQIMPPPSQQSPIQGTVHLVQTQVGQAGVNTCNQGISAIPYEYSFELSEVPLSSLPAGNYTITLTVGDTNGNVTHSAPYTFTITSQNSSTIDPGITVNETSTNPVDTSATFSGIATGGVGQQTCTGDQEQPIAGSLSSGNYGVDTTTSQGSFNLQLSNSGIDSPCGSYASPQQNTYNYNLTIDTTGLSNGQHTLNIVAKNNIPGSDPATASTTFTVMHVGGTVNVTADNPTNWYVSGCSTSSPCTSSNATSGSYSSEPTSMTYIIKDPGTQSTSGLQAKGFSISNNNPLTYQDKQSILARIIHTADAASSSCSNAGFTCYLATTSGATVSFNLVTNYCKSLNVTSTVNGNTVSLSGISYTVSGGPSGTNTYNATPQTISNMVADPINGTNFTLNMPSTISYNGYTADLSNNTSTLSYTCTGNSSATLTAAYTTRAQISVQ